MAIIKHQSSKNANYGKAEEYLKYEHDEKTGKVLRDENGDRIQREGLLIDGINCALETFQLACRDTDEWYGKNQKPGDVKSHSYIISFDPRDQVDNGLTPEMVQAFGLEFVRKYLPGYHALVSTHLDGHHGSGNLHCHIVIGSVRIMDVPRFPYMDQPMDNLAGGKHRATPELMRFFKQKVMEMCQERGLYQTDLLHPPRIRKSEKEYFAEWNGSQRFGEDFQTNKAYLRHLIEVCAERSSDLEGFREMMQKEFSVRVRESRGRFSYVIPGRERGITERQLGTDYSKAFIEKVIRGERKFLRLEQKQGYRSSDYITPQVKQIVDITRHPVASTNGGYAFKVRLSNLRKTADTLNYLAERKISGFKEIQTAADSILNRIDGNTAALKQIESRMGDIQEVLQLKEELRQLRPVIQKLKSGKESADYRRAHNGDLVLYQSARETLKRKHAAMRSVPENELQAEYQKLSRQKNALYEERSHMKKDLKDMENAKHNLEQILGKEKSIEQRKERNL